MLQPFNPVCYDAYERLLALPDPADLPRRGHVVVCEGDPNRRKTRLPRILTGWLQRHYLAVDGEVLPTRMLPVPHSTVIVSLQKGLPHYAHSSPSVRARALARLSHLRRMLGELNRPVTIRLEK